MVPNLGSTRWEGVHRMTIGIGGPRLKKVGNRLARGITLYSLTDISLIRVRINESLL